MVFVMNDENLKINVAGLDFRWDLENGKFLFEEQDAVFFWIESAMKTFFEND